LISLSSSALAKVGVASSSLVSRSKFKTVQNRVSELGKQSASAECSVAKSRCANQKLVSSERPFDRFGTNRIGDSTPSLALPQVLGTPVPCLPVALPSALCSSQDSGFDSRAGSRSEALRIFMVG
jgi:hypothetical protein